MKRLNNIMDSSPMIKRMQEFKEKVEAGKGWVKKKDSRPVYYKKDDGYYLYIGNEISNEDTFNFYSFRTIINHAGNLTYDRKQEIMKDLYDETEYRTMYNELNKPKSGSHLDDVMDKGLLEAIKEEDEKEYIFME